MEDVKRIVVNPWVVCPLQHFVAMRQVSIKINTEEKLCSMIVNALNSSRGLRPLMKFQRNLFVHVGHCFGPVELAQSACLYFEGFETQGCQETRVNQEIDLE